MLIQSFPESVTAAEVQLRSDAAPSVQMLAVFHIGGGRNLTVANIMAGGYWSNTIFSLVPELNAILAALRHVPDVIANDPSRVAQIFEEALWLGRPRFCRRSSSASGERSDTDQSENTH
jgi:hypothetical protein